MAPSGRSALLLAGTCLTLLTWVGPLAALERRYFVAHMIAHLVLMMLAVPLLLLGRPIDLALTTWPRLEAVLDSRILRWLANPLVAWLLFVATIMGVHFSPFLNFSLSHPLIHYLVENTLYFVTAFLYYWPILPGNHPPNRLAPAWRVGSLFAMMVPETMTGFFIYIQHTIIYPYYLTISGTTSDSVLTGQQLGGGLMWAGAMIIDSVWIAVAVQAWYRSEERKSLLIDAEIAAENSRDFGNGDL